MYSAPGSLQIVSLDTETQTLILKTEFILDFIEAIDLGFGCLQRTEFQSSRADVVILDDDGICNCSVSLPRDQPISPGLDAIIFILTKLLVVWKEITTKAGVDLDLSQA